MGQRALVSAAMLPRHPAAAVPEGTDSVAECDSPMAEYDDVPWRPFHLRVCIASTGGVFADGFGLGIIGIALQLAAPQLHLSAVWLGLLGGASLAGLFAGALLTGLAADRFGRRRIFAYNMVFAAALSALQFT